MNKRDKLKFMLEKTEDLLRKENQKTILVMTIYHIIICGIMMYTQNSNIKEIIVEAVICGIVISYLALVVYSFYTSVFTNKELIEKNILKLKKEIDGIDRTELSDEFIDDED